MQVVVCILGIGQEAVFLRNIFLERALGKDIRIPLAVLVAEFVLDHGTRIAAPGTVEIDLCPPEAIGELAEQAFFQAESIHIAVAADGGRVVAVVHTIGELVASGRIQIFPAQRGTDPFAQLPVPYQSGIGRAEGAGLEGGFELLLLAVGKPGDTGLQVDAARRPEILGGLKDGALLAVVQGHCLHIVQREPAQVHRAVLRIAQLDAVIEHAHMVGAHAADIDGLQSAHTAIVLDLHAGEVADGIGHAVRAQPLQLRPGELLHRDDLPRKPPARHHHFFQLLQAVQAVLGVQRQVQGSCQQ